MTPKSAQCGISRALEALPPTLYRQVVDAIKAVAQRPQVSSWHATALLSVATAIDEWELADLKARGLTRDRKR